MTEASFMAGRAGGAGLLMAWVLLLGVAGRGRCANAVLQANRDACEAVRFANTPPPAATRWLAVLHVAQFDAINGLGGGYFGYRDHGVAPSGASPEAAAAAAANQVLRHAWPAYTIAFDATLQGQLAALDDGDAVRLGVDWGRSVALDLIREREFDGSQRGIDHRPSAAPGHWQPTPPLFASALLPQWAVVRPFVIPQPDAFRPMAPPVLGSDAWAGELREVRTLGSRRSTERTADQTEIAWFWADGPGTYGPPGHWNEIARLWSGTRGDGDLLEVARCFALLNLALADAAIATWDAKFAHDWWRPVTALRAAGESQWLPLVETPPFPEHVSGHSTFSAAAAAVLGSLNGDDRFAFTVGSGGMPGVVRSFSRFSEAAEEAGISRIYGGIHFQSANRHGRELGRAVARHVLIHALRRLDDPSVRISRSHAGITVSWRPGDVLESAHDPTADPHGWSEMDPKAPGMTTFLSAGDRNFFRVRP